VAGRDLALGFRRLGMSERTEEPEMVMRPSPHHVITPAALVFALTPEHYQRAQECLRRSGRITISFTEVAVTRLPETLQGNGVLVD
jgi:hypothetical protein